MFISAFGVKGNGTKYDVCCFTVSSGLRQMDVIDISIMVLTCDWCIRLRRDYGVAHNQITIGFNAEGKKTGEAFCAERQGWVLGIVGSHLFCLFCSELTMTKVFYLGIP